jgi:hypothetical protein
VNSQSGKGGVAYIMKLRTQPDPKRRRRSVLQGGGAHAGGGRSARAGRDFPVPGRLLLSAERGTTSAPVETSLTASQANPQARRYGEGSPVRHSKSFSTSTITVLDYTSPLSAGGDRRSVKGARSAGREQRGRMGVNGRKHRQRLAQGRISAINRVHSPRGRLLPGAPEQISLRAIGCWTPCEAGDPVGRKC